jgi:hypothetical protein
VDEWQHYELTCADKLANSPADEAFKVDYFGMEYEECGREGDAMRHLCRKATIGSTFVAHRAGR